MNYIRMRRIIYLDNSDGIHVIRIAFLLYCTTPLHILQYTTVYVTLVSEPKILKSGHLLGIDPMLGYTLKKDVYA